MSSALPPRSARSASGQLVRGTVLNNTHRIEALVARGGMGEVYRATNLANGDAVAVKVLRPEFADESHIVELFRRESAALRKLRDPAIVFYEGTFFGHGGLMYLVMEFVDGPSLKAVAQDRPLSVDAVRRLRDRLAKGLAAAHAEGVIHRDLSPENVILPGGRLEDAKLIDFGIAKQASASTTLIGDTFAGKYGYAAPEQFGLYDGRVDPRTDVYSLGLLLAYCAGGRALDMGHNVGTALAARRAVPDLSHLPKELRADLAPMLAPNPASRPQSMNAVLGQEGARLPSWRVGALAATAAAAALAALAWFAWPGARAPVVAPPAAPAVIAEAPRPATPAASPSVTVPPAPASVPVSPPPPAAPAAPQQGAHPTSPATPAPVADRPQPVIQVAGVYPQPQSVFRDRRSDGGDCSDCPEMVVVPAGRFTMGTPPDEQKQEGMPEEFRGESQPQTPITVRQAFALGRTHVTRAQYEAFVRATGRAQSGGCRIYRFNPSNQGAEQQDVAGASYAAPGFDQTARDPVVCVSWSDAQAYAQWLSQRTGYAYRLPSEAEWEYAARAGTQTTRWWGDDPNAACPNANVADRTGARQLRWPENPQAIHMCADNFVYTAPVGSFRANPFGLHDMLGNAFQWVEDCWNATLAGRSSDERPMLTGECREHGARGGAWNGPRIFVRSGFRGNQEDIRDNAIGFRVARTLTL
jgi:formylglycine-generating enzyme required for sulfatase activity